MLLLRVSCNFAIFRQLLLQVQFCLLMLLTNGLLTCAFVGRARSQIFLFISLWRNVTFLNAFISNTHARIRIVYNWYVAFCKWAFTWKICTLGLCLYVVNLINERSTVTVCTVQIL